MKTNIIIKAVIPGLIAAAAITLFYVRPVSLDSLVGYGTIVGLLGILAVEYRLDWKRLFGR